MSPRKRREPFSILRGYLQPYKTTVCTVANVDAARPDNLLAELHRCSGSKSGKRKDSEGKRVRGVEVKAEVLAFC